jgi:hypothetical protein
VSDLRWLDFLPCFALAGWALLALVAIPLGVPDLAVQVLGAGATAAASVVYICRQVRRDQERSYDH